MRLYCAVQVCSRGDVVRAVTLDVRGAGEGNMLGEEAIAALSPALCKLVSLTSLDLSCT